MLASIHLQLNEQRIVHLTVTNVLSQHVQVISIVKHLLELQ